MIQPELQFQKEYPGLPAPTGQVDRLIRWLQSGRSITAMDSVQHLGIMRLAARIHDAKRYISIESKMITVHNRWGEKFKVAEYRWNH